MLSLLESGSGGLTALHHFVDAYHSWLDIDAGGRGCLALNSGAEMGVHSDTVSGYAADDRQMVHRSPGAALQRAKHAGEIGATGVESLEDQLVGLIFAAALLNRSGSSRQKRERFALSSHDLIDSAVAGRLED